MGWNVFYKQTKLFACHKILKTLNNKRGYYTKDQYGYSREGLPQPMTLLEIKNVLKVFSVELILDSLKTLNNSGEIIYISNDSIEGTEAKINEVGIQHFKEKKYLLDIFSFIRLILNKKD